MIDRDFEQTEPPRRCRWAKLELHGMVCEVVATCRNVAVREDLCASHASPPLPESMFLRWVAEVQPTLTRLVFFGDDEDGEP